MFNLTDFPKRVGVMLLNGAVLLPGAMIPLYIFEPRYRRMLSEALDSNRIFAIAQASDDSELISMVGGAGLIRACVKNEDGTSHLILQGICRVRLSNWDSNSEYPLAEAEVLTSSGSDSASCHRLRAEILNQIERLVATTPSLPNELLDSLKMCENPAAFSDVAAACLVTEPSLKLLFLDELNVLRRLEILAAILSEIASPAQDQN